MPRLWDCLSDECRQRLAAYQWERYGQRLDVALAPPVPAFRPFIEPVDEIDRLLRQPPRHPLGDRPR